MKIINQLNKKTKIAVLVMLLITISTSSFSRDKGNDNALNKTTDKETTNIDETTFSSADDVYSFLSSGSWFNSENGVTLTFRYGSWSSSGGTSGGMEVKSVRGTSASLCIYAPEDCLPATVTASGQLRLTNVNGVFVRRSQY